MFKEIMIFPDEDLRTRKRKLFCDLHVGDHIQDIIGLHYFQKCHPKYEVIEEYPDFYVVGIKFHRNGSAPEILNYICTSISKASIYCRDVKIIKEDGREVKAYQQY